MQCLYLLESLAPAAYSYTEQLCTKFYVVYLHAQL